MRHNLENKTFRTPAIMTKGSGCVLRELPFHRTPPTGAETVVVVMRNVTRRHQEIELLVRG